MYVLSYAGPAISYLFIGISSTAICLVIARVIAGKYNTFNVSCIITAYMNAGLLKHGLSTGKALLTDITPQKELSNVLGYYQACSSAGFIAGPVIGGYLIDWDPTYALVAYACSSVFVCNSVLCFLLLPSEKINQSSSTKKAKEKNPVSILFSFKYFSTHGDFIVLRFLLTFSVIMMRTNFSIFLAEKFGIDNKTLGYITSLNAIAGTLSLANVGYIAAFYNNRNTLLKHALFLLSASLMFISFAPTVTVVVVGLIPLSIATSNLRVCLTNLSLSRSTEDDKGALIGLSYSVSSFSRTISPTLVGIMQEFDVTLPCYFSGLTAITATLMSLLLPLKGGVQAKKKQ